jgi:hypothetical protein
MKEPRRGGGTVHRVNRILFGGTRGLGHTVYGTVVAMAALAAGSAHPSSPRELAALVATTSLVIWAAHVYSHSLGESIETGHRLSWGEIRAVGAREVPILTAAVGPLFFLVLGVVGVMREHSAVWAAFGIGLVVLAVEGARYAQIEHVGRIGMFTAIALNLGLGVCVVVLKVIVLH